MRWSAIIVAAGRGKRFGGPKQLIPIAGAPMITWSARIFAALADVEEFVVATEAEWIDDMKNALQQSCGGKPCTVVEGGATRQGSVYAALREVGTGCEAVLIHDGARPLLRAQEVADAMHVVRSRHASLLAIPVIDTVKVAEHGVVLETLPRESLWAAQTPQCAMAGDLRAAHEKALRGGVTAATDDATLLERSGVIVHIVPGSAENFKVTLPQDLERADELLRRRLARAL